MFLDLVRNIQGLESEKTTNKVSFHAGQEIFHTVAPKGINSKLLTAWPKKLPFRDRTAKNWLATDAFRQSYLQPNRATFSVV